VAEAMGVSPRKQHAAAESSNRTSNLEPCDYQADALAKSIDQSLAHCVRQFKSQVRERNHH